MITPAEIAQRLEIDESYAEELLALAKHYLAAVLGAEIEPQQKTHYLIPRVTTNIFQAPEEGPFIEVISVTAVLDDVETQLDWKLLPHGEILTVDRLIPAGTTVAVEARCGLTAPEETVDQLLLMTCRYFAEGWRREYLPDISSISYSGIAMSYRATDPSHPTGVRELDGLIRSLRRRRMVL